MSPLQRTLPNCIIKDSRVTCNDVPRLFPITASHITAMTSLAQVFFDPFAAADVRSSQPPSASRPPVRRKPDLAQPSRSEADSAPARRRRGRQIMASHKAQEREKPVWNPLEFCRLLRRGAVGSRPPASMKANSSIAGGQWSRTARDCDH